MPPRNVPTVIEIRGRQLIIWEDIDNKFLRACLAEFLAMHLFVLLCCGCAMVTLNIPNPNLMMVAASFGFGILTLAQIFGPLSGGHINSAVSLGLFVAGRTSFIRTLCFTLSQMLGSVFGALFLWAIFGNNWPAARAFGSNSWDESVFTGGQVFFAETLGTALLMFNVLSTIDIPTEGGGPLGVYPIAMSVMVAHLFLIPIDGCSINPTRSFGPSLVATWAGIPGTYYHQQAMFWFAPMFGAAIAALLYGKGYNITELIKLCLSCVTLEYGSLKPENFAGAKDMDTAIFQAGKRKKGKKGSQPKHDAQEPTIDTTVVNQLHVQQQSQVA
jgi:glycerol uptake facilitator-like aquaporin